MFCSMKNFEKLLEGWMLDEENGESAEKFPWKVTEEQKLFLKDKVSGYISSREYTLVRKFRNKTSVENGLDSKESTCQYRIGLSVENLLSMGNKLVIIVWTCHIFTLFGGETEICCFCLYIRLDRL